MAHLSVNMEDVTVNRGEVYLLMDALYLEAIRATIDSLDIDNLNEDIQQKAFPYNDIPFATFKAQRPAFSIHDIKAIDYNNISREDPFVFSSDTGVVLLINEKILMSVVRECEYEELVDSAEGPVNRSYWDGIVAKFKVGDLALILAPGLGAPVDFSGSGTYRINNTPMD